MSNDEPPISDDSVPPLVVSESFEEGECDVELIVPAPAYEVIATGDELETPTQEPEQSRVQSNVLLEALQAFAAGLNHRLDQLQTVFEREIRAEATREKVVDRLHAELQEYKQDLLLKVLRPVILDLVQLHDDLGKMADVPPADDVNSAGRWAEVLRGFQQGVEDILYRQGIEPFAAEGELFDPRRQRAVATVPTEDAARNKTIASRLRKGFQSGDRVLRPEIVSVYALKKTT